MEALLYLLPILGAVGLAYDHSGSTCNTCKESDYQIGKGAGSSGDSSQGFLSQGLTYYYCVDGVVEGKKKSPEKNREEEKKNLFPDSSFSYAVSCPFLCHTMRDSS